MAKQKMPDGWVKITWKDAQGRKFSNNIPVDFYGNLQIRIMQMGGVVVKEEF